MRLAHSKGFSLPEVLIVITILAIMAGIAIPIMTGITDNASLAVAKDNLSLLNNAVTAMATADRELTNTAGSDKQVFDALQTRDATSPGSPYLTPNAKYFASSATNVHRARWNGRVFQLIPKGTSGSGIVLERLTGSN